MEICHADLCEWKPWGAARKAAARNLPEEQARKILNQIRELSGDSAIRFKSLAAYAAEWLQSKQVTLSEGTFVRYKGFVDEFVTNVGKQRAATSIEAIAAQDVKAFRDLQAMEKAVIEKGLYSELEFERLRAELERVEKEENILCVSNCIFSTWVVKRQR
jgi:hypothetical protein